MIENKKSEKANLENKKSIFFLIGLVIALSSVLYAFEWKTSTSDAAMEFDTHDYTPEEYIFIPRTPAEKKEIPKPMVQVEIIKLVENDQQVDDIFADFSSEPDDGLEIDFSNPVFKPSENPLDKPDDIFIHVEIMPEFPGGKQALLSYLANNVKYPLIAQENGIKGKVYVSFVIDELGNINDVDLLRGVDSALDNEALRVVRGMPKWKPGKQAGKAVKVRYTVPIYFELR
ncbi:energy transducer TonB [uncultured Draconibacterium sp.]|uniref:energy transducer TonB n=1 Tax=uncultured Draconibacterium sp. TaxID=1573823 RepID=UPI003216A20E